MRASYEDQLVAQNVRIACENRRLRFTLELIAGFSDDAIEANPLAAQLVGWARDGLTKENAPATAVTVPEHDPQLLRR